MRQNTKKAGAVPGTALSGGRVPVLSAAAVLATGLLTATVLAAGLLAAAVPTPEAHPPNSSGELWGANGHRIVGEIAERHLTKLSRARARALLDGAGLARVASWADDFRGTPEGRYTSTWHYATLPAGEYAFTPDDGNIDVGEAIRNQAAILADETRSREERSMALRFVVHFVGDVHQPMHVGNGRDRGGNDVEVLWFDQPRNLHSVWDSGIIEHQGLSYTEWVDFIDRATAGEIARWQSDPLPVWIAESRDLRIEAYSALGEADVPRLGWDYRNAMTPQVERRLLMAGVRLAGLINRALGG